jgi:hypothetical protein
MKKLVREDILNEANKVNNFFLIDIYKKYKLNPDSNVVVHINKITNVLLGSFIVDYDIELVPKEKKEWSSKANPSDE